MDRRQAIATTLSPLTVSALSLTGCDERSRSTKGPPVAMPPFSAISFHQKLDLLASAYAIKSPRTQQFLQPGLTETQIRERTAWFANSPPQEIISLYQWRNGFLEPKDSDILPFMFRDYVFLPLEVTQREYKRMMDTYGQNPQDADLLASSFPFAALGGGWLVVSTSKQTMLPMLERPVISVFQGISVFFYSMEKMAETCSEWLSHPKHNGFSIPPNFELEVWRKVNPGIFPE